MAPGLADAAIGLDPLSLDLHLDNATTGDIHNSTVRFGGGGVGEAEL